MKDNRLGPRQWAFVVVVGGAVFALPFMQRQTENKPEPPQIDAASTLLPETLTDGVGTGASSGLHASMTSSNSVRAAGSPAAAGQANTSSNSAELLAEPSPATWPVLPHSPFEEMVQQKAIVIEPKPTEEIVPMQPLRPWISAPNLTSGNSAPSTASSLSPLSTVAPTAIASNKVQGSVTASPWREDEVDSEQPTHSVAQSVTQSIAQSYGQGRRQLSVAAGPADQYTAEEIAQKLNLPKQELVSAIVPASEVLPPPIDAPLPQHSLAQQQTVAVPKSSVVLSRQPSPRPLGAQVRFGQGAPANDLPGMLGSPMTPLPTLPEERRGHIIKQPR